MNQQSLRWVILAGGQAQRMGGEDKGLISLNYIPFIQHVINRLTSQTHPIVINANRNIEQYERYAPVYLDLTTDFMGPLGGIQAAFHLFSDDWIGFVPCDTPNIPEDLVKRLYASVNNDVDILCTHDGERTQPTVTLIHRRVLPQLDSFLAQGDRKIQLFHRQCRTQFVDFSDNPNAFINLNTPQDIQNYS